jgi:hypothetical protein
VRPVVLQAATTGADHEVRAHADGRHDRHRADDEAGLLLPPPGAGGWGAPYGAWP